MRKHLPHVPGRRPQRLTYTILVDLPDGVSVRQAREAIYERLTAQGDDEGIVNFDSRSLIIIKDLSTKD